MKMTEQMAIRELEANIDLPFGVSVSDEASKMAIQALEERRQYRAIGTVEELQALKEKSVDWIGQEAKIGDSVWFYWAGSNWCEHIHYGTVISISVDKDYISYEISLVGGYRNKIEIFHEKDEEPLLFKTEEEARLALIKA